MNFAEQLSEELKTALRSKDKVKLKVVRELKSRVRTWEINHRQAAGEADFIKLVQTAVKQRKEAIILFEKADDRIWWPVNSQNWVCWKFTCLK